MVEEKYIHDLHRLRELFLIFIGIAVTLLVTAASGDTPSFTSGIPLGWFTLWIVLTISGIPLGILLLLGPGWRRLPLLQRRGIAMGFLMIGFINFFSLALHLFRVSPGFPAFICPVVYALILFVVYVRVYIGEDRKEEYFP
jgi:hypothetical protein